MYDSKKTREKLRDLLRSLGVDIPDELPDMYVEVVDEKGNIIKSHKAFEPPEEKKDG